MLKPKNSKKVKACLEMWKQSDDAIYRSMHLDEIYPNVPKSIANVRVNISEYHNLDCDTKTKKKVMKWLNS